MTVTAFWLTRESIARCLTPPEPKRVPKISRLENPPAAAVEHVTVNPGGCGFGVLDTDTVLLHVSDEEGE